MCSITSQKALALIIPS